MERAGGVALLLLLAACGTLHVYGEFDHYHQVEHSEAPPASSDEADHRPAVSTGGSSWAPITGNPYLDIGGAVVTLALGLFAKRRGMAGRRRRLLRRQARENRRGSA